MTEPTIKHTPNSWQALLWLLVLALVPFLFVFRMKIQSLFYTSTQCNESRRRDWHSFDVSIPSGYNVHGIDVSHYSCNIDWAEVKKMNQEGVHVDFAYMRATRGLELLDYEFAKNWEAIRDENILRGAYHFFTFRDNAVEQAHFFLQNVQIERGDLPPVLDIENDKTVNDRHLDRTEVLKNIETWLRIVEAKTGVPPIIYTNLDYFKRYISGNFKHYPIWIASYQNPNGVTLPDKRKWWFWQFSENARCNGISEPIDMNIFAGTKEQLYLIRKKTN